MKKLCMALTLIVVAASLSLSRAEGDSGDIPQVLKFTVPSDVSRYTGFDSTEFEGVFTCERLDAAIAKKISAASIWFMNLERGTGWERPYSPRRLEGKIKIDEATSTVRVKFRQENPGKYEVKGCLLYRPAEHQQSKQTEVLPAGIINVR